MKKSIILFAVMITLLSCGQRVKVWENPQIGVTQYTYINIKKVSFYKDSTVLDMKIHYPSFGGGFTFGKDTYIEADGKRYPITGCDCFVLGEYTNTDPDTWEKEFTLYFEPLPRNTKMFDIIEGTFDGAYTFFNIRPDGVELPVEKVPAEYLADYPEDDVWPDMTYSEDPVTVHFKAINYKPGMKPRIDIWHFDITNPSSFNQETIYLDDEGTYDYTCKTYYPEHLQIDMVTSSGPGWASSILPMMAPGQELTVLIDMNVTPDSIHDCFVGLKGYMAKHSMRDREYDRIRMFVENRPTLAVWTAENAKTVSELIAGHDSVVASVKAFNKEYGYSDEESRRFFDYELRFFSLVAEYNGSLFRSKEFLDYILKIRPACFFDEKIDIRSDYEDVCHLFADTDIKGVVPDFCRYLNGVKQLRGGKQIKKPFIEDPYLSNLYDRISGNMNDEIAKNKRNDFAPNVHYLDLTEVAPKDILKTILDRYKGKTVVLDAWATWCGWCIKGHEEMAPYKEELKDKDIVFVYITSSSSPFERWFTKTGTIPGEHYYLTEEQDNYISSQIWGEGGVPKYAIFDANGKQLYKQVGWGGLEIIKTEIEKALSSQQ